MTSADVEGRIRRLSAASGRLVEPDLDVPGSVATRPIVAPDLLSVAGLGLSLSDEQWAALAREEIAAITEAGVRFEAVLIAGFSRQLSMTADLTDERVVYVLHELGEETRHSRLFIRLLSQLRPQARNPFLRGPMARVDYMLTSFALRRPALFCVMVLAGEEIPDLFQRRACEHPATDRFFRAVSEYHRREEARHLAYARLVLPELWQRASRTERFIIRWMAPTALRAVFDTLVHPGVYESVGLPGWTTWRAVRRSPERTEFRRIALAGVLDALVDSGAFASPERSTRPWRRLVGASRRRAESDARDGD